MVDVAVVGAGILGAALAEALTRRGAAVTVIDAAEPGSGTSGSSLAWLNANHKLPRHYHDLNVRGIASWRELAAGEPWHVPTGSLTWAGPGELDDRLRRLRDWGYPVEELTAGRAAVLEPALRVPDDAQVAFFPGEAFVYGDQAVQALLTRARERGARLVVTGGDVSFEARGSRVAAVRLPGGERLHADVYVSCAGWRIPRLLEPLGASVPLVPAEEPGSPAPCLVTRAFGAVPVGRVVNAPGLSLRPVRGGVQLEAGDTDDGEVVLARARELIAGFEPREAQHRVCVRPLPVDGHPLVGWLPGLENAYVSVTHSGMTLGPLLGELAAREIVAGQPGDDLGPYRPGRPLHDPERWVTAPP
ncbi:NAD(P)/FAD-dependent oxidoreductase [Actinoplanes sp. URMC 104]|uniref:NAD(P)/FAD-dependent oxidoreductase n=1 Tax=Actinoplanes sp. URMC 104 TaxID=3423409 RepID=UPI003F1DDFD0